MAGYHLVNIAIHLLTACLVYLLLKRVFRSRPLLAFGGALIFVAHPLQTQAVTYIVQRATSLTGLFFFLALYLYVRAREAEDDSKRWGGARHWLWYGTALACGALAVFTKQNAAVLPVALILFDRYFLPRGRLASWKGLLAYAAPFALAPAWSAANSILLPLLTEDAVFTTGSVARLAHLEHLSPLNYLVTEFPVMWLYLRLLFLPYGQALDYDIPIVASPWNGQSVMALLGILLLFAAAVKWRKKWPAVSAGILWFFLAQAVESTIIPLDPVFEHRLYIPLFGFALVLMGGLRALPRRIAPVLLLLAVGILGVLTWQRNDLWNNPQAFYEDNLRQAPHNERVLLGLANIYLRQGRLPEAEKLYKQALDINPGYVPVYTSLSNVYVAQRKFQEAVALLRNGLRYDPMDFSLYNNLGISYKALRDYPAATEALQAANRIYPESAEVHYNLAVAYQQQNLLDRSIAEYRRAIELKYDVPMKYYFNLGMVLLSNDQPREALSVFQSCYRANPSNPPVLYNLALAYRDLGDLPTARSFAAQLQRVSPGMASRLIAQLTSSSAQGEGK